MLDYEVARLDKMYEDFDNKSDPFRAVITWLCRPNSLPQNVKGLHGMEDEGVSPFNNRHEVVGEAREFAKDISAETIHFKCLVVPVGIHEDPAKYVSSLKKSPYPCYVQRFNMVKKGRKFAMEPFLLENKEGRKALRSMTSSRLMIILASLSCSCSESEMSGAAVSGWSLLLTQLSMVWMLSGTTILLSLSFSLVTQNSSWCLSLEFPKK